MTVHAQQRMQYHRHSWSVGQLRNVGSGHENIFFIWVRCVFFNYEGNRSGYESTPPRHHKSLYLHSEWTHISHIPQCHSFLSASPGPGCNKIFASLINHSTVGHEAYNFVYMAVSCTPDCHSLYNLPIAYAGSIRFSHLWYRRLICWRHFCCLPSISRYMIYDYLKGNVHHNVRPCKI